jgi:polysaccharide deacetylase family protein (PEP-CTERM system associated)
MLNSLTIDVEEYFHPTEVQRHLDPNRWDEYPSRVGAQTYRVLELLAKKEVKATFFILGWVAERQPELVRAIARAGHEIGCHSYAHQLVYELSPSDFRRDTVRAVRAIEDAGSVTPVVYRAPSYSITGRSWWALEILAECGFTRDSSVYPIVHDRYGVPGFSRHAQMVETPAGPIQEVPVGTVCLPNGRVAPIGGGAYLRLLPYRYTAAGIRRVNGDEGQPVCIYFHPWELDPHQPRLAQGFLSRVRTYGGLSGMERKLERLLSDFHFTALGQIYPQVSRTMTAAAGGPI